jgi:endonuclease III
MEKQTPMNAVNHFRNNRGHYRFVRSQLSAMRQKFDYSDISEKVELLQKSHAFAVLSVQTPVDYHELAFRNLFANGLPLSESEIRDSVNMVNYYKNKSSYIWDSLQKGREWEKVASMLEDRKIDEAHKYVMDTFKGVGPAKAPFVLSMLGFTEKMCIDTNVANIANIERPNTVVVEKYEKIVSEIKDMFKTLAKETGSSFLFQWALFDFKRGELSKHQVFYNEMGVL